MMTLINIFNSHLGRFCCRRSRGMTLDFKNALNHPAKGKSHILEIFQENKNQMEHSRTLLLDFNCLFILLMSPP